MFLDPVNATSRILTEVQSCLKLPGARGAHVGVSVKYDSGLWELGRGDAGVGRGFTVGYSSYITSVPGTGAVTRYLKLNAEGSEDFLFDASAANGPYYIVGKTAATGATWVVEEKSGSTVTGYQVVTRRGEQMHYDASGQLDGRQDETGNHVTITWENAGNLKRIKNDATGQSVELAYGVPTGLSVSKLLEIRDAAANRPAGSTEPLRKVTLTYDTNGRLAELKEDIGQGNVAFRTFAYDAVGRPANMFDANNGVSAAQHQYTRTEFEGTTGRVISQTSPIGVFSQFKTVTGQAWNIEVRLADNTVDYQTVRFTLDANGRMTRRYDNANSSAYTAYVYGASGQISKVTDAEGRTVDYLYDAASGQPTQIKLAGGTPDQAITSMAYNADARPTQITDPMGRVTEMAYCTAVSSVCGVVGALRSVSKKGLSGTATPIVTLFETNANNQVTAVVRPDGTRHTMAYDSSLGLPTTTTVAAGTLNLMETSTYDWRGYLRQSIDPRGILTQYEVNGRGWVTAMVEDAIAGGKAVRSELTYDKAGNVIRLAEDVGAGRLNRVTEMDYAAVGPEVAYKVIARREAVGTSLLRKTTFSFSPAGEPYFTDEPMNGNSRYKILNDRPEFIYTGVNRNVKYGVNYWGEGARVLQSFDRASKLISVRDPMGSTSTMTYNGRGDLLQVKRGTVAVGTSPAVNATLNYTYSADGKPSTAINPATSYQMAYTYDTYGRLDTTTESGPDTSSRWTQTVYDAMDRVTSQRKGTGAVTLEREDVTYDAAGRPLGRIKDPLGVNAVTTYSYTDTLDPNDNVHLRQVTDPTGSVTRSRYDTLGKLVETIDPAGSSFTFSYDNLGHMLSQTGASRTQSWTVDLLGRNTEHTSALGTERWVYNPDDTIAIHCPVSGQATACDANNPEAWKYTNSTDTGLRRLNAINYPERAGVASADVTYTYVAAAGGGGGGGYTTVLDTVTDALGTTGYTYDALNRMRTKKRTPKDANGVLLTAQAKTLTYGYKAADTALASVQYWDRGTVNYTTNAFGQVTKLTDWAAQETSYTYAATGQLGSVAANQGNAYTASFTYDSARRLSRIQHTQGAGNLLDLSYAPGGQSGRDAKGNLKAMRETWLGEGPLDTSYTYDTLDRLLQAQYPDLPTSTWGAGATGAQYSYGHDAAGNVTTVNGVATFAHDTADRVTTAGFTHDANGNMTASGAATLASNPQALNMLTNPGFESGLSGWTGMSGSSPAGTWSIVSSPVVVGASAVKITNGVGGWGTQFVQNFPQAVSTGQTYAITGWARGDVGGEQVFVAVQTTEGAWQQWLCTTMPVSTTWTKVGCQFTVPSALNGRLPSLLLRSASDNGTIYMDDVTVQQAATMNLMNLSFDDGLVGWSYVSSGSTPPPPPVPTSTAHSGAFAATISHSTGGYGTQLKQNATQAVATGETYQMSAWLRGATGTVWYLLQLTDADTGANLGNFQGTTSTTYAKYQLTVTIPSTSNGHHLQLVVRCTTSDGTIYADDVTLDKL